MPNLIRLLFAAVCALSAAAAPAETICSDRPALLAAREGVYASSQLVRTAERSRRWDKVRPDAAGLSELRISPAGIVTLSLGWHEGGTLGDEFVHGCLVFSPDQVRLRHSRFKRAGPFQRLGGASEGRTVDAPYFDMLFKGCFADAGGERWCFRTNAVEVAGVTRAASLKLDQMELPVGGSVLEVAGESDFLLFVPRGNGWAVYRTTWAFAKNFHAPVWSRPWKVLSPAR